jgi:regulator of sirC expression with transglutaminase-like and TPR domain
MRRRAKKEKEKAASINPRTGKPWSKSTLRRRAKKAAGTRPAAAAQQQNESKVKKGKTLNEQLQEISKRWGFDK